MSIGNLKDSGNQGNNFPFQLKVLQGLDKTANQTKCENLTEYYLQESTLSDMKTAIQMIFDSVPNGYLISKQIVWNGVDYGAFITIGTL